MPKKFINIVKLKSKQEIRFSIKKKEYIVICLLNGSGEIFGTELLLKKNYKLTFCEIAIFTWHPQGCKLKISGNFRDTPYHSNDTLMLEYLNLNMNLDNMRRVAKEFNDRILKTQKYKKILGNNLNEEFKKILPSIGPRVLVIGSKDSGKTTLCQILSSYATRSGFSITLADIDPSLNVISLPGAISTVSLDKPFDIEIGVDTKKNVPITFWYGHERLEKKKKLYMKVVKNLVYAMKIRWICNKLTRPGGCIINSAELENGDVLEIIKTLNLNVLLIINQEKTYNFLNTNNTLKKMHVTVSKLPKSEGVVKRSNNARSELQKYLVKKYFYGLKQMLNPCSQKFKITNNLLRLKKISVSDFLLSLTTKSKFNLSIVNLNKLNSLSKDHILAISFSANIQNCSDKNIAGFLYLADINFNRGTFTCFLPCPFIPQINTTNYQSFWILGEIKWT